MSKGRLFYMVGLARSGKSMLARDWATHPDVHIEFNEGYDIGGSYINSVKSVTVTRPRVVITGDEFRLALHGKEYEALAECQVFASMDQAIRAMLNSGFDVLVDETATTPETHKRMLRIDIDARPWFVDTSVEECIRRAIEGGKQFLVEPIKRMDKQLRKLKTGWPRNFERWKKEIRVRFHKDIENSH